MKFAHVERQHYEFYYFIVNKTAGPTGLRLFPYSTKPPVQPKPATSAVVSIDPDKYDPLARPPARAPARTSTPSIGELEGGNEDPTFTKVVDRRWYERNKHIFPASVWEEFDPVKDYSNSARRDAQGNAFFFS